MSQFTYEKEDRVTELETYEWDNVWWDQAPDPERSRVLYIGDSISCGIRHIATELTGGKLLFDGFGTSKAVDNGYFAETLRLFGKQQGRRDIVIFNNGLHGFHLDDTEAYGAYYEKMVRFLLEEFEGTPIALVNTTSIDGERNERVIVRNDTVQKIAQKYSLPVIDLYQVSLQCAGMRTDGVHYSQEGYKMLAQQILADIRGICPGIDTGTE